MKRQTWEGQCFPSLQTSPIETSSPVGSAPSSSQLRRQKATIKVRWFSYKHCTRVGMLTRLSQRSGLAKVCPWMTIGVLLHALVQSAKKGRFQSRAEYSRVPYDEHRSAGVGSSQYTSEFSPLYKPSSLACWSEPSESFDRDVASSGGSSCTGPFDEG